MKTDLKYMLPSAPKTSTTLNVSTCSRDKVYCFAVFFSSTKELETHSARLHKGFIKDVLHVFVLLVVSYSHCRSFFLGAVERSETSKAILYSQQDKSIYLKQIERSSRLCQTPYTT